MNWIIGYLIIGVLWTIYDHIQQWRDGSITKVDRDVGWSVFASALIWPLMMFITWVIAGDDKMDCDR